MGRRGGTYKNEGMKPLNKHRSTTAKLKHATAKQNRFVFQNFLERISQINIDIAHKICRNESLREEKGSYFLTRLDELKDLNRTQDFQDVLQELSRYAQSLPMIVYHLDHIVGVLLTHLKKKGSTCFKEVTELLSILARDMRSELYPYFKRITEGLTALLDPSQPEKLEAVFVSLSYVFKFLTKQLVDDVPEVYRTVFLRLLTNSKPYVRKFAAESLSFLLRKVRPKDIRLVLHTIISVINQPELRNKEAELRDGIGMVLFETIKGVNHTLHNLAKTWLPLMVRSLSLSAVPVRPPTAYNADVTSNDELYQKQCNMVLGILSKRARKMTEKVGECLNRLLSSAPEDEEEKQKGDEEVGVKTRRRSSKKFSKKQQAQPGAAKKRKKLEYRYRFLQIETGRLLLLIDLWGNRIHSILRDILNRIPPLKSGGGGGGGRGGEDVVLEMESNHRNAYISSQLKFIRAALTCLDVGGDAQRRESILASSGMAHLRRLAVKFVDDTAKSSCSRNPSKKVATNSRTRGGRGGGGNGRNETLEADLMLTIAVVCKGLLPGKNDDYPSTAAAGTVLDSVTDSGGELWPELLDVSEELREVVRSHLHASSSSASSSSSKSSFFLACQAAPIVLVPSHNAAAAANSSDHDRDHKSKENGSKRILRETLQVLCRAVPAYTPTTIAKESKEGKSSSSSSSSNNNSSNRLLFLGSIAVRTCFKMLFRYVERSGFAKDDVQTVSTLLTQPTSKQQIGNGDESSTLLSRLKLKSVAHMCEQHPNHPGWASALKDCLTLMQRLGGGRAKKQDYLKEEKRLQRLLEIWLANPDGQLRKIGLGIVGQLPVFDEAHRSAVYLITTALPSNLSPGFEDEKSINLKLTKLTFLLSQKRLGEGYVRIAAAFFLGVLRVKFSLIWPRAQSGLVECAKGRPAAFWSVMLPHLKELGLLTRVAIATVTTAGDGVSMKKAKTNKEASSAGKKTELSVFLSGKERRSVGREKKERGDDEDADDDEEEGQEEADLLAIENHRVMMPGFSRLRERYLEGWRRVYAAMDVKGSAHLRAKSEDISSSMREWTDHDTTEKLVYEMLSNGSVVQVLLVENPERLSEIVEMFFSYLEHQHDPAFPEEPVVAGFTQGKQCKAVRESLVRPGGRKAALVKVELVLAILKNALSMKKKKNKKKAPNNIHSKLLGARQQDLYDVFLVMVSKRNPKIQSLAFECLCTFRPPGVMPYKNKILKMIDDKTMREGLREFSLDPSLGVIEDKHRQACVCMVLRVLFPKLLRRKIQGDKSSLKARRTMLFAYFSAIRPSEIVFLVKLVAGPFSPYLPRLAMSEEKKASAEDDNDDVKAVRRVVYSSSKLRGVTDAMKAGFLTMMGTLINQMRLAVQSHAYDFLMAAVTLYREATSQKPQGDEEGEDGGGHMEIEGGSAKSEDKDDVEDSDDDALGVDEKASFEKDLKNALERGVNPWEKRIRSLACKRITEILGLYPELCQERGVDCIIECFLEAAKQRILNLHFSCYKGCPSLLTCLHVLSLHPIWKRAFAASPSTGIAYRHALRGEPCDYSSRDGDSGGGEKGLESKRLLTDGLLRPPTVAQADIIVALCKILCKNSSSDSNQSPSSSPPSVHIYVVEIVLDILHQLLTSHKALLKLIKKHAVAGGSGFQAVGGSMYGQRITRLATSIYRFSFMNDDGDGGLLNEKAISTTRETLDSYFSVRVSTILEQLTGVLHLLWSNALQRHHPKNANVAMTTTIGGHVTHALRSKGLGVVLNLAQKYGASATVSDRVLALMLPLLNKAVAPLTRSGPYHSKPAQTALQALRVIKTAMKTATSPLREAQTVVSALRSLQSGEGRKLIAEMVEKIGERPGGEYEWLQQIGSVLRQMNSIVSKDSVRYEQGDRDLDEAVEGYRALKTALSTTVKTLSSAASKEEGKGGGGGGGESAGERLEHAVRFLFFSILFDLQHSDRSMRACATSGVSETLRVLCQERDDDAKLVGGRRSSSSSSKGMMLQVPTAVKDSCTPRVIATTLLAGIRRGVSRRGRVGIVRGEGGGGEEEEEEDNTDFGT
eukprot:jgi/Bigna1/143891/aug1.82_g18599